MHPQVSHQSFKKKQESPSFLASHVPGISFFSLPTWLVRPHSSHFQRSWATHAAKGSRASEIWVAMLIHALHVGGWQHRSCRNPKRKAFRNYHKMKYMRDPFICILSKENKNREQQGQAQEEPYLLLWFSNFISCAEAPLSVTALWEKVPLCTAFSCWG